ncbi:hypothetical protein [Methanobacterium sp.]|uniref:hypothetical protein n=1 Tax=Methanobacterium sp. TaxID=2164 RepID=UPI003158E1DC
MKLDHAHITTKAVEVSKCFLNKQVGIYGYELYDTRKIGNVARLAVNIMQADIIEEKQLAAIGSAIQQDYAVVKSDLIPELEKLNYIEVEREGDKIKKVYESIPPIETLLPELGEHWEEKEPKDVDRATIESLEILKRKPVKLDTLLSEISTSKSGFESALTCGKLVNYFGTFKSSEDDEEILWTPYYWANNVDNALKFLKRQSYDEFDNIEKLAENVVKYPGKPIENVEGNKNTLIAGINHGFFPSVGIKDLNQIEREYIFAATPQFGLDPININDIFEKARLIVACVRHGQHHADISRIRSPLSVLYSLRSNTMRPHSYALTQYELLLRDRIVNIESVPASYGNSYKVTYISTPENDRAMDIAVELLEGEEPIGSIIREPKVDAILAKGIFNYTAEQRQIKSAEHIDAKKEYNIMMEYLCGSRL